VIHLSHRRCTRWLPGSRKRTHAAQSRFLGRVGSLDTISVSWALRAVPVWSLQMRAAIRLGPGDAVEGLRVTPPFCQRVREPRTHDTTTVSGLPDCWGYRWRFFFVDFAWLSDYHV